MNVNVILEVFLSTKSLTTVLIRTHILLFVVDLVARQLLLSIKHFTTCYAAVRDRNLSNVENVWKTDMKQKPVSSVDG